MDAVSGVTPFALCDPRVDSIGNQIQDETGAAIAPADVAIDKTINQDYGTFVSSLPALSRCACA